MKTQTKVAGLVGCTVLASLLLAGIGATFRDEPPPDTRDLELPHVADVKNSFDDLLNRGGLKIEDQLYKGIDAIVWESEDDYSNLSDVDAHKKWDAKKLDALLEKIPPEVWMNFDTILQAPETRCSAGEIRSYVHPSLISHE